MRHSHYDKWTRAEVDLIFRMRDKGFNTEQIAKKLGRTKGAVFTKISRIYDEYDGEPPRLDAPQEKVVKKGEIIWETPKVEPKKGGLWDKFLRLLGIRYG